MAGETTTTTLADSIYAYVIGQAIAATLAVPIGYNLFVFVKDIGMDPTSTWRSIVRDDITDAIAVAEADDVTDASMTDSKVDISVDTVARSVLVTYEASSSTILGLAEIAEAARQVTMAVRRKMDTLLWTDTTPNLTNESGDNTTELTYDQFVSFALEAQTQWNDSPPPGSRMRAAIHSGPFGVLVNDMVTSQNSIFASTFGGATAGAAIAAMGSGGLKNIAGVETLVTDRIPAADTTGKGNVFCMVGGEVGSCFGLAVKWGIQGEQRTTEKKLADRYLGHARIGFGILRQELGLKAITAAA